jgi:hypothetical protein
MQSEQTANATEHMTKKMVCPGIEQSRRRRFYESGSNRHVFTTPKRLNIFWSCVDFLESRDPDRVLGDRMSSCALNTGGTVTCFATSHREALRRQKRGSFVGYCGGVGTVANTSRYLSP